MLPPVEERCVERFCTRSRKWLVEQPGRSQVAACCSRHLPRLVARSLETQRQAGSRAPVAAIRDLDDAR